MNFTVLRRAGVCLASLALAGTGIALGQSAVASAAPFHHYGRMICTQGTVRPGVYTSLKVYGYCTLTDQGTVIVQTNLTVGPTATFWGVTNGTLIVRGNATVGAGGTLDVGCNTVSVGPPCTVDTPDEIGGSVTADRAKEVVFHTTAVEGNFDVTGSSTDTSCTAMDPFSGPAYFDFEDGQVFGNLTWTDVDTCWLGTFRTWVGGNMVFTGNMTNTTVPGIAYDSPEIASNVIVGALDCTGNVPKPTFGDSGGKPNIAGGGKHGQCKHL